MLKVAFVAPALQSSSGWRTMTRGAIGALRQYVEPVIFVAQADFTESKVIFPGLPVYPLPLTQQGALKTIPGIIKMIRNYAVVSSIQLPKVDLVHSLEAYPTGLVGDWLARRLKCPHVISPVGTYAVVWARFPVDRRVYTRVLKNANLVCPISEGTKSMLQQYFGQALSPSRMQVVLIGNDYYKKIPRQAAFKHSPAMPPILLSVGEVKPRKGQQVSLQAFAQLKTQFPEARYLIIGRYQENAYFQRLQGMITSQNIKDVTFMGVVTDQALQEAYSQAHVFVLTPQSGPDLHFEGFGLVYLEAGAYGIPVVGSRTGGVPDAVRDGETGILVEPEDVNEVAHALARLLNDRELAIHMGQANRLWAESLTWERYAEEQARAYLRVTSG